MARMPMRLFPSRKGWFLIWKVTVLTNWEKICLYPGELTHAPPPEIYGYQVDFTPLSLLRTTASRRLSEWRVDLEIRKG